MMHSKGKLNELSVRLIRSVTSDAGKCIKRDAGVLENGKPADMVLVKLPTHTDNDSLALHTILHTNKVEKVWIDGEVTVK